MTASNEPGIGGDSEYQDNDENLDGTPEDQGPEDGIMPDDLEDMNALVTVQEMQEALAGHLAPIIQTANEILKIAQELRDSHEERIRTLEAQVTALEESMGYTARGEYVDEVLSNHDNRLSSLQRNLEDDIRNLRYEMERKTNDLENEIRRHDRSPHGSGSPYYR